MIFTAVLLSCTPGSRPGTTDRVQIDADSVVDSDDSDSTAERVEISWGQTETCDSSARTGMEPFFDSAGRHLLVHGQSDEDAWLADTVYAWYSEDLPELEVRDSTALSDEDLQENLFIIGSSQTNGLLMDLNGHLPVWFDQNGFTFGGYRYDDPGHGIALIHPNPWNSNRSLLVYGGNSVWGSYALFTVWTEDYDYSTTRGRGTLQQEGRFCRDDGAMWSFFAMYDHDYRDEWEAWVVGLSNFETKQHTFFYEPGSEAENDIGWLAEWQEDQYDDILSILEVDALDYPIITYLYPSNEQKGEVTGDDGNAHANDLNLEVHAVYGDGTYAVGAHEDVHVVAWFRIGKTNYSLMGEGLAVMVEGEWWSRSLDYWASSYADDDLIPNLQDLIENFWSYDSTLTYPLAGHFIKFLYDGWGIDAIKTLYLSDDLEVSIYEVTGLTCAEIEVAWRASIP